MHDLTAGGLARLRRTAEAATPGPWQWAGSRGKGDPHAYVYAGDYASEGEPDLWCEIVSGCPEADAQHIATFGPTAVLALLDEIERLRRQRDTLLSGIRDIADELGMDARGAIGTYRCTEDPYDDGYIAGLQQAENLVRERMQELERDGDDG